MQFVNLEDQLVIEQIGKVPPSTNFGGLLVNQDVSGQLVVRITRYNTVDSVPVSMMERT